MTEARKVAYCGSSQPHAEHKVGGVGRMGPFTTMCEGIREMTTTARPPLGELTPGQKVMIRRSSNDMRRREPEDRYIPAVVVKAARVWVELKADETAQDRYRFMTWRMRRDTQDQATQYSGSNASFATLQQHEWDEARAWAFGMLQENGIRVDPQSRWHGREVELADLISKGEGR